MTMKLTLKEMKGTAKAGVLFISLNSSNSSNNSWSNSNNSTFSPCG